MLEEFSVLQRRPDASTTTRAVVEGHLAILYRLAEKLTTSSDLWLSCDAAGMKLKRDFCGIVVGGTSKKGKDWVHFLNYKEISGVHSAVMEVELITNTLKFLNGIQSRLKLAPLTRLYHFTSIVYDNASVNTGANAGVGALFGEARLEQLIADRLPASDLKPFLRIGTYFILT
jgi:hypothetical protein